MPRDTRPPLRFGVFEVDLRSGELHKQGLRVKLQDQPFRVLAMLLEHPGQVVTREELHSRLWPADTFVDFDNGLNNTINRLREALGDSADNPRFIETLPRRGYRFIAPVENNVPAQNQGSAVGPLVPPSARTLRIALLFGACALLAGAGLFLHKRQRAPASPVQRALTRLTFDDGLQIGATWSPDGRFIAYSSDRAGKFDIWVQQVSGGDPVKITKRPGQNWQPDWSPDGKHIAYRSEDGNGGLFVVPALGGEGLERKIASFGYYPRWSPDSSQILFRTLFIGMAPGRRFFLVGLDGSTPREVLANFISQKKLQAFSAAWHPDGKRISLWAVDQEPDLGFWTLPVTGGVAVKSEIVPEILRRLREVSAGPETKEPTDLKFSWAPSGKAIYFGRSFRGAPNLWKMTIDPETLRATAIERLTTGSGHDTELSVSADGRKLAFTEGTRSVRAWLFPFDATRGLVRGAGQAVTSTERAWNPNLSRDGKKLAFCGVRSGRWQVWEKSLVDGHEAPVITDDYSRDYPQWSREGTRLAYRRLKASTDKSQIMVWSGESHNEEALTTPIVANAQIPYDWSLDGERLLVSLGNSDTHLSEVWLLPVAGASALQGPAAKKIISDPAYDLFQPHYSPDGRWIVFEAIRDSTKTESTLYVMPSAGGSWTRISRGEPWDDKPCWSPDGKTIYFVSREGSFFNVRGIRFDPRTGKPVGEPFRVKAFESPSLMIPNKISGVDLSVTQDKLVINVEERSGSIWMLDNVDR